MKQIVELPECTAFVTYCGRNDERAVEFCLSDSSAELLYTESGGIEILRGAVTPQVEATLTVEGEALLREWNEG